MQRHWSLYLLAFALLPGLLARPAVSQEVRPLVELSRPNAVGSCDTGFKTPSGPWPTDDAGEPVVAVNPIHPNNVVTAWFQGHFQDIIAAVSLDGGQTWQRVPIPFTTCSGGPFLGAGDPWLSFASNGDLYAVAVIGNSLSKRGIGVSKSGDGGLHWSAALVVPESLTVADHPSLTADPRDARFVYAIWDYDSNAVFSRTTDGGLTWKPAHTIVRNNDPQSLISFSQILVLPNGTLVDLYEFKEHPKSDKRVVNLQERRSTNHGKTWSAPRNAVTMTPIFRVGRGFTLVVNPKTGEFVSDPANPSFAVDRRNGNLYAVWEDGRFSSFQYPDTAFAMSADGGLTWSVPIRVNRTPLDIPPANRQAFFPSIAVAADGTIGVSYYDFRFNDPNPGLPTDRWLVLCHPSSARPATDPANWGSEVRLTDSSFNMEAVVQTPLGKFIGDYFGLATAGDDFVSVFTQLDHDNVNTIFFRRVRP